ncbi:MAG: PQQ-dependent sugar dehydrogenase [Kiloniellales bacterium]|nr:PQQ-dependent sugar dehydrogenase [Kiloniellales bacterium]
MNSRLRNGAGPAGLRALAAALALALGGCALAGPGPVTGPAPQGPADEQQSAARDYEAETWIEGLEVPWSLIFLPDGRALVSERPGRIRLIRRNGVLAETPYATLDSAEGASGSLAGGLITLFISGEGGLMGLAAHPDFPERPFIYAMHTYETPDGKVANRVVRLRDRGDSGDFDRVILDGIPGWVFHNGGRIGFGPDGMLYIATGEVFENEQAQDGASLAGKILRLTPDGAVPPDNPFPGSPVYSLGHRNPQGLAWHPVSGTLFASDHGPSGEFGLGAHDEINVIRPGGNYGWPRAVGAPGLAGLADPLVAWTEETTPPGGLAFHDRALFLAVLGEGALIRITLDESAGRYRAVRIERLFGAGVPGASPGRLRDVVSGPDGKLYILTSNRDGRANPEPGDDKIIRLIGKR